MRSSPRSADPSYVRKIVLDAHSREVIYQVRRRSNPGRVVRQIPDEAMLRLRAYNRALAERRDPEPGARARRRRSLISTIYDCLSGKARFRACTLLSHCIMT